MAESEEELKSLLMNRKEESEKVGLKLNIQKINRGIWSHHFLANRWGYSGNFKSSSVLIKSLDSSEIMSYFLPLRNGLLTVILASNSTIQLNDPQTVDLKPVALASPVNLLDVQLSPAPSESCYIRHVSC